MYKGIGPRRRARQDIAKSALVIAAIIGIGYYTFLASECITHWQTLLQGRHDTVMTLTGVK